MTMDLFPTFNKNGQFLLFSKLLIVFSPIPEYAAASLIVKFCFSQMGTSFFGFSFIKLLSILQNLLATDFHPLLCSPLYKFIRHSSFEEASHEIGNLLPAANALPKRTTISLSNSSFSSLRTFSNSTSVIKFLFFCSAISLNVSSVPFKLLMYASAASIKKLIYGLMHIHVQIRQYFMHALMLLIIQIHPYVVMYNVCFLLHYLSTPISTLFYRSNMTIIIISNLRLILHSHLVRFVNRSVKIFIKRSRG